MSYCFNIIKVFGGSDGSLEKFQRRLYSTFKQGKIVNFSFDQFVPKHSDFNGSKSDWNLENWGCKFDAANVIVSCKKDYFWIDFVTLSNPPYAWLKRVAKEFEVTIICMYEIPGKKFGGTITVTQSRMTDVYEYSEKFDNPEYLNMLKIYVCFLDEDENDDE